VNIAHQPERARFVSVIDNQEARLEYDLMPRHGINFTYTFVPEALRGQTRFRDRSQLLVCAAVFALAGSPAKAIFLY
jgi:hypothetical protein